MGKFLVSMLVVVFLFTSCVSQVSAPEQTPAPQTQKEVFCKKAEIKVVDFAVLNEVRDIVKEKSIAKDVVKDPRVLFTGVLESLFAFLSVGPADIPQWARDAIEEELQKGGKDFSIFNGIYQKLLEDPRYQQELGEPSQKKNLIEASITGFLDVLKDPFTAYTDPERWRIEGSDGASGRFRGMGITTAQNSRGEIVIDGVQSGSPAEKAGLKAGDVFLEINDQLVKDCTRAQFTLQVRTLQNPKVKIKIKRELPADGKVIPQEMVIKLELGIIEEKHVSSYPVVPLPKNRGDTLQGYPYSSAPFLDRNGKPAEDIVYIKIKEISDQASKDLKTVLTSIDWSKYSGIILDLRSNPGGLVDATARMADYFLKAGFVFIQEGHNASAAYYLLNDGLFFEVNGAVQNVWDQQNPVPSNIPIAILLGKAKEGDVDNSYSGAEALSAALRDNGRAKIFSREERSGGKGSVNISVPLKNGEYGALYVSIALWKTPSGQIIEKMDLDRDGYYETGGLIPDTRVNWTEADYQENSRNADYDPTLFVAIDYLRGKK